MIEAPEEVIPSKRITVDVGCMVLHKHGGEYGIGEIIHILDDTQLEIHAYCGSVNSAWEKSTKLHGLPISIIISKTDICENGIFVLSRSHCLPSCIKSKIKDVVC